MKRKRLSGGGENESHLKYQLNNSIENMEEQA